MKGIFLCAHRKESPPLVLGRNLKVRRQIGSSVRSVLLSFGGINNCLKTHKVVQLENRSIALNAMRTVLNTVSGTEQRNHCPKCLWSCHVDFQIGDRRSACRSVMEPIAVCARPNGEWSIVHRCIKCGAVRLNRIAGDDNEILLLLLALRPIAMPAFPLDRIGK